MKRKNDGILTGFLNRKNAVIWSEPATKAVEFVQVAKSFKYARDR